jgi:hypothetical protein
LAVAQRARSNRYLSAAKLAKLTEIESVAELSLLDRHGRRHRVNIAQIIKAIIVFLQRRFFIELKVSTSLVFLQQSGLGQRMIVSPLRRPSESKSISECLIQINFTLYGSSKYDLIDTSSFNVYIILRKDLIQLPLNSLIGSVNRMNRWLSAVDRKGHHHVADRRQGKSV